MEFPKVTIALSVYNVESYLRKSLDCIIKQTFRDIEILCIDDCSKDGTYTILEEYASKDKRIRLLKQPTNMGLSCSRNLAMAEAKGEYILMLDGDDLFALDMVEKAYKKAVETDADLVMWDYCTFYKEKEIPQLTKRLSVLIGIELKDKIALLKRPAFMWVKLFRIQVLRDHGVHFPEGLTKQDIPVWWHVVTVLDKVEVLPERLSYYRQNPFNTTSRKDKSVYSLAYVMDITGEYLKKNNLYAAYKDEYLRSKLGLLQGMYDYIKPELQPDAMQMIRERLDTDAIAYINSSACALSKRTILFYKGYMMGDVFAKLQYDSLMLVRTIYRKIKV